MPRVVSHAVWLVVAVAGSGCFDLDPLHYLFVKDAGPTSAGDCVRACLTPPSRRCVNGSTLEAFPSRGVCTSQSGCAYSPVQVRCDVGCRDAGCVDSPCVGVFCDVPPASVCDDATHLRLFDERTGVCVGGGCTYQPTVVDCPDGCVDGTCKGNLCAGKVCASPPSSVCLSSSELRRYVSPGSCSAGQCTYLAADLTCANGCSAGACSSDPCADVSCAQAPADSCLDAKTRRVFAPNGVCGNGHCTYVESSVPCASAETCTSGRCVPMSSCNVSSCSGGCCEGNTCVSVAEQNDSRCGSGASLCGSCGTGFACVSGTCQSTISCASNNGGCSTDATCSGSGSARTCVCKPGFEGDGFTCLPSVGGVDAGPGCGAGCPYPRFCWGNTCVAPSNDGGNLLPGDRCDFGLMLTNGVPMNLDSSLFVNDYYSTGPSCSPLNAGNDVVFVVVVPGNKGLTVEVTPEAGLDTSISVSSSPDCARRVCEQSSSTGAAGVVDRVFVSNENFSQPQVFTVTVDSAEQGGGLFGIVATVADVPACDVTNCAKGCCLGNRCVTGRDERGDGCGTGGVLCDRCESNALCRDQTCQTITGSTGGVCRRADQCYQPVTGGAVCNANWPNGGYCSSLCLNAGAGCGGLLGGSGFCTLDYQCLLKCAAPGTGRSNCPGRYFCENAVKGNTSSQGVCVPNCNDVGGCTLGTGSCGIDGHCR